MVPRESQILGQNMPIPYGFGTIYPSGFLRSLKDLESYGHSTHPPAGLKCPSPMVLCPYIL